MLQRIVVSCALLLLTSGCFAQTCEWLPDLSNGKLDVTFYITSDSEIGRGRPVEEYMRYQRDLVAFSRTAAMWPPGFRSVGAPMRPPIGIVTTGDNIYGGSDDALPITWLIQKLRFEWLWSRSRVLPPFDVFVNPDVLQIERIPYPVYTGLGNHDWDLGSLQDGIATLLQHIRSVMPGCFGVTNLHAPSGNYSWNWGRLHLVQLNEWAGARDRLGLDWLRQDLSRITPSTPVVLFQHYGFDGFSRSGWWSDANRSDFLDIVCNYNVLGLFTGHTHHAFPASFNTVSCPAGRRLPALRNFIGEDGINYNPDGGNQYYGDRPQGTGTFMVVRVVDDGTSSGSFMDVATLSWPRNSQSGMEIRTSRNGLNFIQSIPVEPESPASVRNLGWGSWRSLGPAGAITPALSTLADGRPIMFSLAADRTLQSRVMLPDGAWSAPTPMGISGAGSPAVLRLSDGRIAIFLRGTFGEISWTIQNGSGGWTGWQRIGSIVDVFFFEPRPVQRRDGRIQVHAVGLDGRLYWSAQSAAEGVWSTWQATDRLPSGAGVLDSPALVRLADGRLLAIVQGNDSGLYANGTTSENGPWSVWQRLTPDAINSGPAALLRDDTTWIFARHRDTGRILAAQWKLSEPSASTEILAGPQFWLDAPVPLLDGERNIQIVTRGVDFNLYANRYLAGMAGSWMGWNVLPRRVVASAPALALLNDGRSQVAAIESGTNNLLYISDLRAWN